MAERLGADPYILGLRYISASWEAEDDKPQLLNQYLELSLKKFSEFLAGHRTRDDRWWDAELLLANLERRLGRFAEARARLKGLPRDTLVEGSVMERNIDQLRSLVEAGDSKPRRMD